MESLSPNAKLMLEIETLSEEQIRLAQEELYKWNLHGGKTTMLYLNLSGHDIFKTRFGTSPEKHCLTATPYRLFQGNLRNLHKIGT